MYAKCRDLNAALKLYEELKQRNMEPDDLTFVCLPTACIKLGDLTRGRQLHQDIISCGLQPNALLRNSLINLYGRAKNLTLHWSCMTKWSNTTWIQFPCCADVGDLTRGILFYQELIASGVVITLPVKCSYHPSLKVSWCKSMEMLLALL